MKYDVVSNKNTFPGLVSKDGSRVVQLTRENIENLNSHLGAYDSEILPITIQISGTRNLTRKTIDRFKKSCLDGSVILFQDKAYKVKSYDFNGSVTHPEDLKMELVEV